MYDWLVLVAIALGPLVGIWVTRIIDRRNEKAKRREAVFEALIKTRGLELSFEHTGALNMVPFLFDERKVREAYSKTMEALNDPALGSTDEGTFAGAFQRLQARRNDLIREVGESVGSPLPQNEQERLGYAPRAWTRQYNEQETLRALLIDAFEGRKALHTVTVVFEPPAQTDSKRIGETSPSPSTRKRRSVKTKGDQRK